MKSKHPLKVRKFKTVCHVIYKEYKDTGINQKYIEDFCKKLWLLSGSCSGFEKDEIDKVIISGEALADELGVKLKEDEKIRFNW